MKPGHEERRKIIRGWMAFPKDKRQTKEQLSIWIWRLSKTERIIEDSRGRLGDRIEELIYTNYTNDFVFLSHLVSPLVEIPRRQWRDVHR